MCVQLFKSWLSRTLACCLLSKTSIFNMWTPPWYQLRANLCYPLCFIVEPSVIRNTVFRQNWGQEKTIFAIQIAWNICRSEVTITIPSDSLSSHLCFDTLCSNGWQAFLDAEFDLQGYTFLLEHWNIVPWTQRYLCKYSKIVKTSIIELWADDYELLELTEMHLWMLKFCSKFGLM